MAITFLSTARKGRNRFFDGHFGGLAPIFLPSPSMRQLHSVGAPFASGA